jgi:hypothetical protein
LVTAHSGAGSRNYNASRQSMNWHARRDFTLTESVDILSDDGQSCASYWRALEKTPASVRFSYNDFGKPCLTDPAHSNRLSFRRYGSAGVTQLLDATASLIHHIRNREMTDSATHQKIAQIVLAMWIAKQSDRRLPNLLLP